MEKITSPTALDRRGPLPLWAQLRDDLARRVAMGEFAEAFPSEMALVEAYGVSRNTVRDALRRLRADGMVVAGRGRRPRLGDQVEIQQPLGALYSLFASVESAGLEPTSVVRSLSVTTDPKVAERLECPGNTALVHLERLRLANGDPLALDRVWFPAQIAAPLLDADFTRVGFYDELASRTGIRLTGGRERLRAAMPSRQDRALLELPSRVAAFAIERLGFVRDRPVELRHTVVRGDRFSVVAEFSAGIGYRLDIGALAEI